ncbi:hypothetical protein BCV70DRAFT_202237 [Testicularia cyperi]|uniref:Phosphatidate phosphatase APP1 catalytic domain-containing protein n=1 Tax=Testicularia cyperi TaxID=1882483 RepID=A0A317XJP8_9BASI|nr:hypothetical protein BCV70DRAFT_202237 [Testicularia cyperi]
MSDDAQNPKSERHGQGSGASMSRFQIRNRTSRLLNSGVDYIASRDWQAAAGSVRDRLAAAPIGVAASRPAIDREHTITGRTSPSTSSSRSFSVGPTLQRIRDMSARPGSENVVLLPGWVQRKAARDRHPQSWSRPDAPEDLEDGEIELHMSLHGFVSKVLDTQSRSQRVFNQMARQLAGLPKIYPAKPASSILDSTGPLTEEPFDLGSDLAAETTAKEYRHISDRIAGKLLENADDETIVRMMENLHAFPTDAASREAAEQLEDRSKDKLSIPSSASSQASSRSSSMMGGSLQWENRTIDDVTIFHNNLNRRLDAYWVYRSAQRDVYVEVSPIIDGSVARDARGTRLIMASTRLTTDASGQFEHRLIVPWHMLSAFCQHFATALQATPDKIEAVEVRAKLARREHSDTDIEEAELGWRRLSIHEDGSRNVRIISDIDDTVKHTGVLHGAKQILRNVFVLPYHEAEIPGIASWYRAMLDLGAGLHYVTNAPLELHSLVVDFLESVRLPISHLVLKHYPSGARSLLSSWLEPAGERKRANVVKILDDFRSSQFILIGDSGELDLELYCALAAERPQQIRGVFIRDVSTPAADRQGRSRQSAASAGTSGSSSFSENLPKAPQSALRPPSSTQGFEVPAFFDTSYSPKPAVTLDVPTGVYATRVAVADTALSEQDIRRAQSFQTRLTRATSMLPRSTVFRLFREGKDVQTEALQLIRQLQSGTRPADR